ncbi:hypothetical protein Tco_0548085 [Tanacetum coccineum]
MFMVFQRCGKWKDGGERESLASATSIGGAVDRRDEDTCRCTFGLGAAIFISDPLLKLSLSILMHPFAEKTSAVVTNRKGHNEVNKDERKLKRQRRSNPIGNLLIDPDCANPALHSGIQDQPLLTTHSELWQDVKKRVMTKQFHKLAVTKNTMAQDLNNML